MNKQIEALKMAIEALEGIDECYWEHTVLQTCKEALAEAENQEIGDYEIKAMLDDIEWYQQEQRKLIDRIKELEKKELQSLSDDEIQNIMWPAFGCDASEEDLDFARAIEQALKEKNLDSLSS